MGSITNLFKEVFHYNFEKKKYKFDCSKAWVKIPSKTPIFAIIN